VFFCKSGDLLFKPVELLALCCWVKGKHCEQLPVYHLANLTIFHRTVHEFKSN